MGETTKKYCDACKIEITPSQWAQGSESGIIVNKIQVWTEGPGIAGVVGELCDTCYAKIRDWFQTKKTAAATDWTVVPPAVKVVTPPTV